MKKFISYFVFCIVFAIILCSVIPELRYHLTADAQTTKWSDIKDAAVGDNQTEGIFAINPYTYDGISFNRGRGLFFSTGLQVDVTRASGNITAIGTSTPADNFSNPTTAIGAWHLPGLYNGATWDRFLESVHGDDLSEAYGGNVASFQYTYDGSNLDRVRSIAALPGSILINKSSNASTNITTNTSTVVKASPGFLNMLIINTGCQACTVAFYDDATSPCNTGFVQTILAETSPQSTKIEHQYANGICVLTAGAGAANISVLYR
jgi:hypothetical protein